jgi:hypothetical protein
MHGRCRTGARKEILASWTSKALNRALTVDNIQGGFHRAGIYPFDPSAMNASMGPSGASGEGESEGQGSGDASQEESKTIPPVSIQEVLQEVEQLPCSSEQYLVNLADSDEKGELHLPSSQEPQPSQEDQACTGLQRNILENLSNVLTLP